MQQGEQKSEDITAAELAKPVWQTALGPPTVPNVSEYLAVLPGGEAVDQITPPPSLGNPPPLPHVLANLGTTGPGAAKPSVGPGKSTAAFPVAGIAAATVITFVLAFLVLASMRPKFVHERPEDEPDAVCPPPQKFSPVKALAGAGVVAVLTCVVSVAVQVSMHVKSRKTSKTK